MKRIIADLVEHYEHGRLSRRELIQGLTLLAAAGPAVAAQSAPAATLTPTGIDHVSLFVSDLERSAEFYRSLFGLSVLSEDREHRIVRLGRKGEGVIISLRHAEPHGVVDHFGVRIEGFDRPAVTRLLEQRGLRPAENWEFGYHFEDPDGVIVQLV